MRKEHLMALCGSLGNYKKTGLLRRLYEKKNLKTNYLL
jgi:hypothetical protein